MKIMIIHCHVANRGDEAAIHALVDELNHLYDDLSITLALRGITDYPNMPVNVHMIRQIIPANFKSVLAYYCALISRGKLRISESIKRFLEEAETSDLIVHAPGGPSIGDTYYNVELSYLRVYDLIRMLHKPYMFYAPSMGPFYCKKRNAKRIKILKNAKAVVLRDPISAEYVRKLISEFPIYQTLDSAFQHDIDLDANSIKLKQFSECDRFLQKHEKIIGITITDLLWHPVFSQKASIAKNINKVFEEILPALVTQGFGILFIPQLYGAENDFNLMNQFALNSQDYFIIPNNEVNYDAYFQQYIISRLYAVIGMRYHSNVFSAKMGTPFLSISYEQKMKGFMEKAGLQEYCIPLEDLSAENILRHFNNLNLHYAEYKNILILKHDMFRNEAYKTTQILKEILDDL